MSFNTIIDWNSCTAEQQRQLLMRPAISASWEDEWMIDECLCAMYDASSESSGH